MYLLIVFLFCVAFVLQCNCLSLEIRTALATLDDETLQKLDIGVRKELLVKIAHHINRTTILHKEITAACETHIKASIDQCNTCRNIPCTGGNVITDAANTLVDGIKNVGSSVSNAFNSIFGKRCTQSCPVCDQINIQTLTQEQIMMSVCGQSTIKQQQDAIQTVNKYMSIYNTIMANHVLTKVEYDPTSIKTEGGISFITNFATFVLPGKTLRYHSESDLKITDIPATATSLANQIWTQL